MKINILLTYTDGQTIIIEKPAVKLKNFNCKSKIQAQMFYKSFAANFKKGKIFGVGQNNISTIYTGFRNKKITKREQLSNTLFRSENGIF